MKQGRLYPLGMPGKLRQERGAMGESTGEFRPPKRGEWYLSGAIPEAYQAPNDVTVSFHICRLVVTEQVFIVTKSLNERRKQDGSDSD